MVETGIINHAAQTDGMEVQKDTETEKKELNFDNYTELEYEVYMTIFGARSKMSYEDFVKEAGLIKQKKSRLSSNSRKVILDMWTSAEDAYAKDVEAGNTENYDRMSKNLQKVHEYIRNIDARYSTLQGELSR